MAMAAGSAAASVTYYSPITVFEDDNMEWFFDNNQNGTIDIGDRFAGVLEVTQTYGAFGGGPSGFGGQELTGVFDWTVQNKAFQGTQTINGVLYNTYNFTFAPTVGGLNSGFGPGAMIALYLGTAAGANGLNLLGQNCINLANCTFKAGMGDGSALYAVAGYTGDTDEFAQYTGIDLIAAIQGLGGTTTVASGNFGLGLIVDNTGQNILPIGCNFTGVGGDGMVDVCGQGSVLGGQGLITGASARSDFDFQVQVPEPESLALFGIALLGLAATRRKRQA
jgi:hypothetical protein